MNAVILLLRDESDAVAACECHPDYCDIVDGDVRAVCVWLDAEPGAAEACTRRLRGEYFVLNVVRFEPRVSGGYARYWVAMEALEQLGVTDAVWSVDESCEVYLIPQPVGSLVLLQGCRLDAGQLLERLRGRLGLLSSIVYPVKERLCARR